MPSGRSAEGGQPSAGVSGCPRKIPFLFGSGSREADYQLMIIHHLLFFCLPPQAASRKKEVSGDNPDPGILSPTLFKRQ
jgi:hypothetical protein